MAFTVRVLIVLSVLFSAGCVANRQVWGFDRDKLASDLYHADYSLLKSTDFAKVSPSDILKLGDGAPYYVGLIFEKLKMDENAVTMFRLAYDRSPEPWRMEAGYSLIREYLDLQQYEKAIAFGRNLIGRYPHSADFAVLYAQALYRGQNDSGTLEQIARVAGTLDSATFRYPYVGSLVADGHLQLWRTASSIRTDVKGWKDLVLSLFTDYPASDVHSRLYLFLAYRKLIDTTFDPEQRMLIDAKFDLATHNVRKAQGEFAALTDAVLKENADGKTSHIGLLTPTTLEDAGASYSLMGLLSVGAQQMQRLSHILTGTDRTVALDIAGRLFLRADKYREAVAALSPAFAEASAAGAAWYTPMRKDRILWYLLSGLIDADRSKAADYLATYLPRMNDYEYFSDLEQELLAHLSESHDWSTIARVYAVLKQGGDPGTAAAFAVVLAEAIDKGLYVPPEAGIEQAGVSVPVDINSLLTEAANQKYDLYSRFLASAALDGLNKQIPDEQVMMFDQPGPGTTVPTDPLPATGGKVQLSGDDRLVRGYFEYGLLGDAYVRIDQLWPDLSRFTLRLAAHEFSDSGKVTDSMRTMDLARNRTDFLLSASTAQLLYPQAYAKQMDGVIEKQKLSRFLFYALVREESYFSADVASHAGAIGLSQLMPQTAADVARRMGIGTPDLTNPETNLDIGAWYLHNLIQNFHDPVLALAAYNGGFGRVRLWQRMYNQPSTVLFHESIPLPETRMYIRKILVSAVYYGHLYQKLSLPEVVKSMFPDFMDRSISKANR